MLPALNGIKSIFGEREGAGAGCRPGVDEAHLDKVELFLGASKPTACLVDENSGFRNVRQSIVLMEFPVQPTDENRIEFDAGDIREAEVMRGEKVAAAAHADHRRAAAVADAVSQVRHIVF